MPEVIIPDVFVSSEGESTGTSSSECASSPHWSIPSESLCMDDFDIPDIHSHTFTNVTIDNGPQLYEGARITTGQAVYTLVSWFSSFPGLSKSAFNRLLYILHTFILPAENNLPTSYADLFKLLKPDLCPVMDYHCCINDCVVYRDSGDHEYADLSKCPECDEDRYETGTMIPRKRFKYMPLENRVRRLFANKITSQLLQNHSVIDSNDDDIVSNIHQSPAWKSWYSSTGVFQGDQRGLSFAICMDGLNPFSREKNVYSTCPMFLMILNLPHHIRTLPGSIMLTGLIAGPKEPKNCNPYVDVLVDDIIHLNTLTLYDGHSDETFALKANIVLNVFDYPGQNKVLRCQGLSTH